MVEITLEIRIREEGEKKLERVLLNIARGHNVYTFSQIDYFFNGEFKKNIGLKLKGFFASEKHVTPVCNIWYKTQPIM